MTGLFSRAPKDPQKKKNTQKLKEIKKLVKDKKYAEALKLGTDVLLLKAYSHQKLGENKRIIQCCDKIKEIDPKNKAVAKLLDEIN